MFLDKTNRLKDELRKITKILPNIRFRRRRHSPAARVNLSANRASKSIGSDKAPVDNAVLKKFAVTKANVILQPILLPLVKIHDEEPAPGQQLNILRLPVLVRKAIG